MWLELLAGEEGEGCEGDGGKVSLVHLHIEIPFPEALGHRKLLERLRRRRRYLEVTGVEFSGTQGVRTRGRIMDLEVPDFVP